MNVVQDNHSIRTMFAIEPDKLPELDRKLFSFGHSTSFIIVKTNQEHIHSIAMRHGRLSILVDFVAYFEKCVTELGGNYDGDVQSCVENHIKSLMEKLETFEASLATIKHLKEIGHYRTKEPK